MLKIGEFSKLSRVSIRMLRHYDEIGLLTPAEIDPFTGYRYYHEEQIVTAGRISALKDMGFQLNTISEILNIYQDRKTLDCYFRQKRAELQQQSAKISQQILLLDTAREWLRKDNSNMKYNVTLKTLPERYVASTRMTIPNYQMEGMLWETMVRETASMNLIPDNPCLCSVLYHDREFRETHVDLEAQKTVKGHYPDTEHVKFKTVPAVTYACATFKGPYSQISEVIEAVAAWVRDNGYQTDYSIFNIYHVSPHETQNPEEFVTEVCCPVSTK